MKKLILDGIKQQPDGFYSIEYTVDGKIYTKPNVFIALYGYDFNPIDGADDFSFVVNVNTHRSQ